MKETNEHNEDVKHEDTMNLNAAWVVFFVIALVMLVWAIYNCFKVGNLKVDLSRQANCKPLATSVYNSGRYWMWTRMIVY